MAKTNVKQVIVKDPFKKKRADFTGFGKKAFGTRVEAKRSYGAAIVRPPNLEDDAFKYTLSKVKDARVARAVLKLKEQYPDGTTPELVTMDWLNRKQIPYTYQAQYGSRQSRGSSSTDFVVSNGGRGLAWEINGAYWHTKHKTPDSDEARARRLINQIIGGVLISAVVVIMEKDIYERPDRVFTMALAGMQVV